MITATKVDLPKAESVLLEKWIAQGGWNVLIGQIQSRVKWHQVKLAETAMVERNYENYSAQAEKDIQDAHRYQIALDVLEEIAKDSASPTALFLVSLK